MSNCIPLKIVATSPLAKFNSALHAAGVDRARAPSTRRSRPAAISSRPNSEMHHGHPGPVDQLADQQQLRHQGREVGRATVRRTYFVSSRLLPECIFSAASTLPFLSSPWPFSAAFLRCLATFVTTPSSFEPRGKPR